MMIALLIGSVALLAYANGANDNFKGVTSLYGSKTCGYRTAITWATVTTTAGSIAAIFLADTLLKNFSGKGLVPNELVLSPAFALAVAAGAGGTVLLATRIGFPISTTHGLIGAMLVTTASLNGMPVSTTHVSVGALLGMGTVTRQAKWKTVIPVIASWVITLPVAAILAGFLYLLAA